MKALARLFSWLRSLRFGRDRMLIRSNKIPKDDRDSLQRFRNESGIR